MMTGKGQLWTVAFCAIVGVVLSVAWHTSADPDAGAGEPMLIERAFALGMLFGGGAGIVFILVAAFAFALLDLYNDTDSTSSH